MFNPDFIIISCEIFAKAYGYNLGEIVPTTRKNIEGKPDKNGYTIYVKPYQHNIRVHDNEYTTLEETKNYEIIDLDIIYGGHGHNQL